MYGRTGDLARLNRDRNNYGLSPFVRKRADRAHATIVRQLKDHKLMRLRLRLINAVRADDRYEISKIEQQMREYSQQDRETGL